MAERKKETQRDGTLQSLRKDEAGSKKKPPSDPKRSGSLQSLRGAGTKKKAGKSKGVVRGGKKG